MQLRIINSNSDGNAYILQATDGQVLLIECGVRFDIIKKELNFKLSSVVGCIVTHEHKDHCKGVKGVLDAAIEVWASAGTHQAMGTANHHRAKITRNGDMFSIGNFKVKPFDIKHDCAEPLGYLIYHPECGSTLFLTDSYYCEYKFSGLNNIIIEANYCQKILDQRMQNGENPKSLRDRVITSHMSLDTCKQTLKSYDLSQVNNIVLIHLSDKNSNAAQFQVEVQQATGKTVHIADAGVIIDNFNKTPF